MFPYTARRRGCAVATAGYEDHTGAVAAYEALKRQRESNQFLSGLTLPRASVAQKKVQQKAVRYEVPEVMIE